VILLHGTFIDEVLIEIVLPLSIFVGLYWWSSPKEKKKKAAAAGTSKGAPAADAAAGRGDNRG